jgi:uncharacterized membrane protein YccC
VDTPGITGRLVDLAEGESLLPDLNRAARGTFACIVPLLLALTGHLPVEAAYAVLAALSIATVDVRGGYALRFTLLLAMTAILATSAGLGGLVGASLAGAVLGMGLVAGCGGLWRHLSSDYGPSLGIASTLIYALGLNGRGGTLAGAHHVLAALAGGLFGLLLQVMLWPFRPEHPLRRTVSESWLALANLFAALAPDEGTPAAARDDRVKAAETAFRDTCDRTAASLALAAGRRGPLVRRLTGLNQAAASLAAQAGALHAAIEILMQHPDFARVAPTFLPVFTAFVNTSRTVALAVVSRQPRHLRTLDLRARRLRNLLGVLRERVPARLGESGDTARLGEIITRMTAELAALEAALGATLERLGDRQAFSLELFEIDTWRFQALAASVDLSLRPDPAVVRYTLRSAVLTMLGVAALMQLHLHHGYWLPFTMMIVLQPDFGSTRQKAAQRLLGTLVGSVFATGLLLLDLPAGVIVASAAATVFAYTYLVKRNYGAAVVFITLFVVLLTETGGKVEVGFMVERVGTTCAGGLLALLAAFIFWPTWERDRFPPILAAAFRANRAYLAILVGGVRQGRPAGEELARARRGAERANSAVFSSLRRLSGDPKNRRDALERAAALANGNQRLTRALSGAGLRLEAAAPVEDGAYLEEFSARGSEALEALAVAAETGQPNRERLDALRQGLDRMRPHLSPAAGGVPGDRLSWLVGQLGRASTELGAMLIA